MKELLKIGDAVDDGTGDYLRQGGTKINNNFSELYYELGDGDVPFSAGAWKNWSYNDGVLLKIKFGQSYVINTTNGDVTVQLPKGSPSDYNKVIRLRDVFSTWQKNPLTVTPASGDTMKGDAAPVMFNHNLQDLELVYCSPGRWEYLENKFINKITNGNLATVDSRSFIATEGQTDFVDVFGGNLYNISNTHVYRRGNRLYYVTNEDGTFSDNSDFGSIGTAEGELVVLDGKSIRLAEPCNEGDTIVVETFMDGVATFQASYNRKNIKFLDSTFTSKTSAAGEVFVGDLSTKLEVTLDDLGITPGTKVNPYSVEILLNGRQLVESGDADVPQSYCSGAFGFDEAECNINGGSWVESDSDYSLVIPDDLVTSFKFGQPFEHGDILTVRWFNNDIGTTLEIDQITDVTDSRYLNTQETLNLVNRIEYTDFQNPKPSTTRPVEDEYNIQISNLRMAFDIFHPIGSVYENMHNPANPSDYMGMGQWVLIGQGKATVGWNSDATDPNFALNNDDLDSNGNPSHTAGGTVGETKVELTNSNIPSLESTDKALVVDDNGPVIVGGCQFDPDETGPSYSKYREDTITVNKDVTKAVEFSIIQPSITVYRWLRVA